jgi:hypothetical protein
MIQQRTVSDSLLAAGFPDQSDYTVTFDWLIKHELTSCPKIDVFLMTPDELEAESARVALEAVELDEADTLIRFNARRQYSGGEAAAEVEEPVPVALAAVDKTPVANVATEALSVAANDGAEVMTLMKMMSPRMKRSIFLCPPDVCEPAAPL